MSRILKLKKLGKVIAYFLCFIMCITFIPILDNESATADAATTIQIGDYVVMGTYYEEAILWRCVDIDQNGPLMLSDKILCLKAFDAGGNVTTNDSSHGRGCTEDSIKGHYRQNLGSNCWEDSNMRCWLNSTAIAGSVTWDCGNKPDGDHLFLRENDYDIEAGFLSNFTQSERNCMKKVSQYQLLDRYEYDQMSGNGITGSTYHTENPNIAYCVTNFDSAYKKKIEDTMFLLDVKQVKKVYQNSATLGTNYYIGEPTSNCVENSTYKDDDLAVNKKWHYWLRSPSADDGNGNGVRSVDSDGDVSISYAFHGDYGVRPAFYLNLSSTSCVSGNGSETSPYTVAGGPTVTIDYANEGTNEIIDNTIEYKAGDGSWTDGNNSKVNLLPGTTYKFRVKATITAAASVETTLVVPSRPSTPSAPTVSSKTDTSITLTPVTGCEYKYGADGTWKDSNEFTGLTAGQSYTFYQRVKATDSKYCSESSSAGISTKASAPGAPTVTIDYANEKTNESIDNTIEYKKESDEEWTDGTNAKVDLLPGNTYKFRVKETDDTVAGAENTLEVPERPDTPSVTINYSAETANTIATYECSTDDGSTWTNCTADMDVSDWAGETVKIRVKATEDKYASLAQEVTVASRPDAPSAPTVSSKTDTSITLTSVTEYEYKCGEEDWQDSNVFAGLTAGQSYTFYQRVKATDSKYCSDTSAGFDVNTKNANSWTTTPAIANVTYGIAINPVGVSAQGSDTMTISYEGTGDTNYNSNTPPTNAGTYKATFTVAETDTYIGLTTDVEFTIAKANPSYSVPTGLKATTGKTLADITLPSGFTWQEATTTSVGSAGTNNFHVKYTPSDTNNYNVVENIEVSVTVTDESSSSGILAIFKKIFSFLPNLFKSLFSIFK